MKKMFVKILSMLLVLIMVVSIFPMSAFNASAATSGTCGDNVTWSYNTSTCTLTISGTGAMIDFSYSDRPWYGYRERIQKVIINSGVSSIGSYSFSTCFWRCPLLGTAFSNCFNLVSVTVSDTVTSINSNAFFGCHTLENIVIPKSVVSIGKYAFDSCYGLTDIYFGGNFLEFMQLTNITKNPVIHCTDGVFKGAKGFCGENVAYAEDPETKILKITGHGSIYDIDSSTLDFWGSPETVERIVIQEGVTRIGDFSFEKFTALKNIKFADSVTSIGDMAFYKCESLEEIVIPDTVTDIGGGLFNGCDSLSKVVLPTTTKKLGSAWLYVLPFEYGFFHYCSNLKNISIPDNVESIGRDSFKLSGIVNIEIPESVTTIDDRAFKMCRGLKNIEIPDSVTNLGKEAFLNCTSLENIKIGKGITKINTKTFDYCSNLTTIMLPSSLSRIDEDAFVSCDKISDVYYAGSEEDWKKIYILSGNTALTNATIHYNYCEHSYGDWYTISESSCSDTGEDRRDCEYCNAFETRVSESLGHSHTAEVTTPATHTATGVMTYTCHCGDTYTEVIAKLEGHTYKVVVTAPTCADKGYTTYTCECGDTYIADYVDAAGHASDEWVYDALPNIYESGKKHKECTVCGDVFEEDTVAEKIIPDVNSDGKINSIDALIILNISVGKDVSLSKEEMLNTDANGDGKANSVDALIILNISVGKIKIED